MFVHLHRRSNKLFSFLFRHRCDPELGRYCGMPLSGRLRFHHSALLFIAQVKKTHLFPLSDQGVYFFEP
jgi:hypothetical protein